MGLPLAIIHQAQATGDDGFALVNGIVVPNADVFRNFVSSIKEKEPGDPNKVQSWVKVWLNTCIKVELFKLFCYYYLTNLIFCYWNFVWWQVGGKDLKLKLLYCLGQACRIITLNRLNSATVISIQQDRKGCGNKNLVFVVGRPMFLFDSIFKPQTSYPSKLPQENNRASKQLINNDMWSWAVMVTLAIT